MKKFIFGLVIALPLTIGIAGTVSANPPTDACNGLDAAHAQIHASGTQGELAMHGLRVANHCTH